MKLGNLSLITKPEPTVPALHSDIAQSIMDNTTFNPW